MQQIVQVFRAMTLQSVLDSILSLNFSNSFSLLSIVIILAWSPEDITCSTLKKIWLSNTRFKYFVYTSFAIILLIPPFFYSIRLLLLCDFYDYYGTPTSMQQFLFLCNFYLTTVINMQLLQFLQDSWLYNYILQHQND